MGRRSPFEAGLWLGPEKVSSPWHAEGIAGAFIRKFFEIFPNLARALPV